MMVMLLRNEGTYHEASNTPPGDRFRLKRSSSQFSTAQQVAYNDASEPMQAILSIDSVEIYE